MVTSHICEFKFTNNGQDFPILKLSSFRIINAFVPPK